MTDHAAELKESRRIHKQMRRLITQSDVRSPYPLTTVGAVAEACKITPEDVAEWAKNAWLVLLDENDGPVSEWTLGEDGE